MEKRRARGVLLDYCPSCSAIWLDGGELDALRTGRARSESELAEQEREESGQEQNRGVTVSGLCPRCQREMSAAFFGDVQVDRCEGCGDAFQTTSRDARPIPSPTCQHCGGRVVSAGVEEIPEDHPR